MRFFSFLITILVVSIVGCSRPDPNPELMDPIYSDLNSQLGETSRGIVEEEKKLEEHKKALSEVIPQTGQIKFATKRVFESEARIVKLKQEQQWLALRIEERKAYTKDKYLRAFKNKELWPDPAELEQYKLEKKLRSAKRTWDVKQRLSDAGQGKPKHESAKKEGGKEEPGAGEETTAKKSGH